MLQKHYWSILLSGGAKVLCILRHRGVQLILAYSWARLEKSVEKWICCKCFRNTIEAFCCRVVRRCRVSYVTGASNWYWLTVGQGLLSFFFVAGKGRWGIFLFLLFLHFHSCSFLPCPSLSSLLLSLLSLFSLSLGDDTKWPTRVDVSLNPNTINQSVFLLLQSS